MKFDFQLKISKRKYNRLGSLCLHLHMSGNRLESGSCIDLGAYNKGE
jgi:hypothetical protein